METHNQVDTDVLIVGAGATGLTLACELARRGVRFRIIDRDASPAITSRALTIQPRTLEVFDLMGIVDQALERGVPMPTESMYVGDRQVMQANLLRLKDTSYPYGLFMPQSLTEQILLKRLNELGGSVERLKELVNVHQEESMVKTTINATVNGSVGSEQINAAWLVGCDGAHSNVRRKLKVSFDGEEYPEEFMLADVDLDWHMDRNEKRTWLHKDGLFVVYPLPGSNKWRIIANLSPDHYAKMPRVTLELFQKLMAERTGNSEIKISNPTWMTNLRVNRRIVKDYRVGRCFLAGDAAHVHSFFGSQGMNTGIQDAFNLAWKLALVINGQASESILDTFTTERKPVARTVLQDTHIETRLLIGGNPLSRFVRDNLVVPLLRSDNIEKRLALRESQLAFNYRASALSKSANGSNHNKVRAGLKAGDRAPDGKCVRFPDNETSLFKEFRHDGLTLLVLGGERASQTDYEELAAMAKQVQKRAGELVKPCLVLACDPNPSSAEWPESVLFDPDLSLHRIYLARTPTAYIIRPDGYIGFCTRPDNTIPLLDYLKTFYRLE
jgi:2-polyprenyl-6-methoxyphenol hydroxylase-like FAD-dependent oxidoreductase